jgi:hypothetical protein
MGTLLVVTPNALANDTSSAEVEKQALAAFGSNAITRTIESFPAPQARASTLELGRTASSDAATEASISYIPDEDKLSAEKTPPPTTLEEAPPPETTPPEEVPPATAAELKKACVDAGLEGPEVLYSHMVKPGVSSKGPSQLVRGNFLYNLMPKFCEGKFRRFASFLVQIKDKGSNKWRNMTNTGKKYWDSLQIDEAGEYTDQEGKALAELSLYPAGHGGPPSDPNSYYFNKNCRPVRSFIMTKVVKDKPKKVHDFPGQPGLYRWVYPKAGQKIKKIAVEVLGKCAKRNKR